MNKSEVDASPYQPPASVEPMAPKLESRQTGRFNLHPIDNVLQAVCIVVCSFFGSVIGGLAGLALGLLFGLLASGIFIMFYRHRGSRRPAE